MSNPKIMIKTQGGTVSRVFVNGSELEGVKGYQLTHRAGQIPQLSLDMKATDLTVEEEALPALPHPYKGHYVLVADLIKAGIMDKEKAAEISGL